MLGTFRSNLWFTSSSPYHSGSANPGSKLYLLGWVVNEAVSGCSSFVRAFCFSTYEMRLGRATEHENGPCDSPCATRSLFAAQGKKSIFDGARTRPGLR